MSTVSKPTADSKTVFLSRFDHIWAQARRVQLSQALCWAILTLLAGIALLAAADYALELPLALRLGAIGAVVVGSLAVLFAGFVSPATVSVATLVTLVGAEGDTLTLRLISHQ